MHSREMSSYHVWPAKKSYIQDFQASWQKLARDCFDKIYETFKGLLHEHTTAFVRYQSLKVEVMFMILVPLVSNLLTR